MVGVFFFFILILYFFIGKIKIVKIIRKLFVSIFILYGLFLAFIYITFNYYPIIGSRVAPYITKEKILLLKVGMDKDEAISILGEPILTEIAHFGLLSNLLGYFIKAEDIRDGYIVYADPGLYEEIGETSEFTLEIRNNRLVAIIIERGDYGVFVCYKDRCPGIINLEALEELCLLSNK